MSVRTRYIIFTKYFSVGLLNTITHWTVFGIVYSTLADQSISNLVGFLVAVTLSFYFNARWTFNSQMTIARYIAMVIFMAVLSWLIGEVADRSEFPPIATLIIFSGMSLVLGYLFTRHFVFRGSA